MARTVAQLLEDFAELQNTPGYDLNMKDTWFSLLESEEQLDLWAALNESKAREARVEARYRAACGLKKE